jgi:hypothetical protein
MHFFMIKVIRLVNGFKIFNVSRIIYEIQQFQRKRLIKIIETDPVKAEDIIADQNKVSLMIMIGFFIKIFKLGMIILNICFFLGVFWYIFCDVTTDIYNSRDFTKFSEQELESLNTELYLEYYELTDLSEFRNLIIGLYFGFTTLSTVGFGDYAPRSDVERSFGAFILLSGVAMFSYLMGNFIDILGSYQNLNAELDDGDTLARFFGMMKHFNDDEPIKIELKQKIEAHFDFIWNNDKNQAMISENDVDNFDQLPQHVQNKLYRDFLFCDFCKLFMVSYFNIPNLKSPLNRSGGITILYSWDD